MSTKSIVLGTDISKSEIHHFHFFENIQRKPPVPIISKTLENLGFS
jgi:hypothetical protein